MHNEIWRKIEDFKGDFWVSNKGRVRNNKTGNILKGDKNYNGYHRAELTYKNNRRKFFKHRLVAQYFIHYNFYHL